MARSFIVVAALIALAGCFPTGSSNGSDGGYGYSSPTLQVTVNLVKFGPAAPTGSATLVNSRDGNGNPSGGSFRLSASIGSAGCQLAFDRFGADTSGFGIGQYTIASNVGTTTPAGYVYPTGAESVATPQGNASCTGSGCDNGGFVLYDLTSDHVQGYWRGTVQADSGAGQADVTCSFYVPLSQYQP
jgi:hypothetical protein